MNRGELEPSAEGRGGRKHRWRLAAEAMLIMLAVLAAIELIDYVVAVDLDQFGVRPRTAESLPGIVLAPLLHGGFGHLFANALPFLLLGFLILLRGWRDFAIVTLVSAFFSGMTVWLIGHAGTVHVGASGVVFGYFGFLISRALFERSLGSAAVAVVVALCYGGLIWGILPGEAGISWESHTGGLVGGALCGNWLARGKPERL